MMKYLLMITALLIFHLDLSSQSSPLVQVEGRMEVWNGKDTSSVFIGKRSGLNADDSNLRENTFVGWQAGEKTGLNALFLTSGGYHNSFFGSSAGRNNDTGRENSFFGIESGLAMESGKGNSFFGAYSGKRSVNGSYNSFFGVGSGANIDGFRNICLGRDSGPIYGSGATTNVNGRLYIDVRASDDPLIYGEFDNDLIRINGDLQVVGTNTAGEYSLNISGSRSMPGGINGHIAQIANENTANTSDVLALKTGILSNPGGGNNYITFYDGDDDAVGRIEGNGTGGVIYGTSGADFAECLPREPGEDLIEAGDIVGVSNGTISHLTEGVIQLMIITDRPALLGNQNEEDNPLNEKVSFIGQVPVKVLGPVREGDWIVASGDHDGLGRAVAPHKLTLEHRIVGRAWETNIDVELKKVNCAVGLDQSEAKDVILKNMQKKIKSLESDILDIKNLLLSK